MRYKVLLLFAAMATCVGAMGQPQITNPCVEILINQRPDNMNDPYYHANPMYVRNGWDTAITCAADFIELNAEPWIPAQWFNGTYVVEEIGYDPPDPTFHGGQHLDITSDDKFCSTPTQIAFPFYFFGIRKTQFVVGSNCIVTFDSTAANQYCAWSMNSSTILPWQRTGEHLNDAILGVYEDTDLRTDYNNQAAPHYQGAWYGIQGTYPCRKIIASWNDVTTYNGSSNGNHRCTYQIVCYEGSNIIEVHIKQRALDHGGNTSNPWNDYRGIIGIVNHNGSPQQPNNTVGAPNSEVVSGSPAAFFPTGFNQTTDSLYHRAFRFTPQGRTTVTSYWYRIYDDGRPNDTLSTNPNDPAGYCTQMNSTNAAHPTLTKAFVHPDTVARYVVSMKFKNAKGDWYQKSDTITIGIDTANDMKLKHVAEPDSSSQHSICNGSPTTVTLEIPSNQSAQTITWTVERILNGQNVALPESMYTLDAERLNLTLLPDPQFDTLPENKVDSIRVQAFVEFQSSCINYDTFLVTVIPNYDLVDKQGICRGETLRWHGHNYTESTSEPRVVLKTVDDCDSIVHLDLTVFDVSHTVDHISDCKPVTWIDGITYSTNNNTATFKDTNAYGCDSIIQLDLTIHPLTPRIESNIDHFDLDHLDVVLRDVSIGGDSRRWVFPTGPEQTSATAYYTIPANLDEADIKLIAHSPYGCENDTNIVIPLNRESFWLPNIFTPGKESGNNLFRSFSEGTLSQEMYIYNRFGEQVYYCSGVDCSWDGTDLNGNPCIQGAYVYIIRYTNIFDPKKIKVAKGTVTLLR